MLKKTSYQNANPSVGILLKDKVEHDPQLNKTKGKLACLVVVGDSSNA